MVQQIIFENKLDTFVIGFTELVSPALKLAAQGALWGKRKLNASAFLRMIS